MKSKISKPKNQYQGLLSQLSEIYLDGQQKAVTSVNRHLVETYWKIGQNIVEFEQKGKERAEYGASLLKQISKDLKLKHGKGFSLSNLKRMRQFYTGFPKGAELPHLLSWTHFVEILKISDELERGFYLQQTINEKWSTTELIRQKKSSLFLRLAAQKIIFVTLQIEYRRSLILRQKTMKSNCMQIVKLKNYPVAMQILAARLIHIPFLMDY